MLTDINLVFILPEIALYSSGLLYNFLVACHTAPSRMIVQMN